MLPRSRSKDLALISTFAYCSQLCDGISDLSPSLNKEEIILVCGLQSGSLSGKLIAPSRRYPQPKG